MKLSICADIMYRGMDFSEKAEEIRKNGFNAVEFWNWSDKNTDELTAVAQNMTIACFCVDSTDKGVMSKIGKNMLNSEYADELKSAVVESIAIAKKLNSNSLIVTVGDSVNGVSYDEQLNRVINSLNQIKGLFAESDMTLLVEPINCQERAKYLTPNVKTVIDIVRKVNSPNVKVLYDIYHQEMEGDFKLDEMLNALPYIGHIHIADVPGRNEPGTGNINYEAVFEGLKNAGYNGYIGCEFSPSDSEEEAFNSIKRIRGVYKK